jgi:hypothetical protein
MILRESVSPRGGSLMFRSIVMIAAALMASCTGAPQRPGDTEATPQPAAVPESLPMGGDKSVMTFFITSRGLGRGGDLGGLAGADAHCQALAKAEGAGDHSWRAYLSTSAADGQPAVHARDRIGKGPWYNAEGLLVAADIAALHSEGSRISQELAVTETLDPLPGAGDPQNVHDILTGSRPDGTAFRAGDDLTCRNWTSSGAGRAQVGHHDRKGMGSGVNAWNSVHASTGCSEAHLRVTGGAGLFYCFGID